MKKLVFSFIILIAFSAVTTAQDKTKGKTLYEGVCKACHAMDKKIIGPALRNIQKTRDEAWLIAFIKDAQGFAKTNKEADALIKEYNGILMPAQPQLSNDDIKNILAYIAAESEAMPAASAPTTTPATAMTTADTDQIKESNHKGLIWSIIFGIFAFFVITWVLTERIKLANYKDEK